MGVTYYFSTQGCRLLVSGLVVGALEELAAAAAACRALRSKKLAIATGAGAVLAVGVRLSEEMAGCAGGFGETADASDFVSSRVGLTRDDAMPFSPTLLPFTQPHHFRLMSITGKMVPDV